MQVKHVERTEEAGKDGCHTSQSLNAFKKLTYIRDILWFTSPLKPNGNYMYQQL
jgi:hypothetical protein